MNDFEETIVPKEHAVTKIMARVYDAQIDHPDVMRLPEDILKAWTEYLTQNTIIVGTGSVAIAIERFHRETTEAFKRLMDKMEI